MKAKAAKSKPRKAARKKPGRRPISDEDRKSETLTIKVSRQVRKDIYRAAGLTKLKPYIWCRQALELAVDAVFKSHGLPPSGER